MWWVKQTADINMEKRRGTIGQVQRGNGTKLQMTVHLFEFIFFFLNQGVKRIGMWEVVQEEATVIMRSR